MIKQPHWLSLQIGITIAFLLVNLNLKLTYYMIHPPAVNITHSFEVGTLTIAQEMQASDSPL